MGREAVFYLLARKAEIDYDTFMSIGEAIYLLEYMNEKVYQSQFCVQVKTCDIAEKIMIRSLLFYCRLLLVRQKFYMKSWQLILNALENDKKISKKWMMTFVTTRMLQDGRC